MIDLGIVKPGSTIRIPFSSFDKDDGSSITMTNYAAADILIYKDGSTTERASTSGFTATTDFDAKTGKHLAVIDLADNTTAGFYAAGSEYLVAIDAVTVDAVTTGGWIARFRIGYPDADLNTTIATLSSQTSFTLTAGPAEDDALNGCVVAIHDVASAVQMGYAVVADYTGSTKTVTLLSGVTFTAAATDNISIYPPANARWFAALLGVALPLTPTTAGRTLDVSTGGEAGVDWANVGSPTTTVGLSGTTVKTATDVETDTADIQSRIPAALVGGRIDANVGAISSDATAADNAESFFDGTGYAGTNNVIPTVTTLTGHTAQTGDSFARIGAAGAGLTAVPWNASWDAEVQSEVEDGLTAYDVATGTDVTTAAANVSVDEIQATAIADLFNTNSGTTYGSAVAGSAVKEIADNAGGSALTEGGIADAVWDELLSGHVVSGSSGEALAAAGTAGDPWTTALPGAYGAGTAGKIIGDNINATISSRASQTSVDTVDGIVDAILVDTGTTLDAALAVVDANVAAILVDTADMQPKLGTPAGASMSADIAAVKVDTAAILVDTGTTLDAALAVVDANVDAILADTADMQPKIGTPAGASVSADIAAVKSQTAAIETDTQDLQTQVGTDGAGLTALPWNVAWDAEVQSEVTDALNAYDPPTNAELTAAVAGGDDAILAVLGSPAGASMSADIAAVKVDTAAILVDTGTTLDAAIADLPTNAELATALDALPTAGENADAVLDEVVEGSTTLRQSVRLANAALGGKASGLETSTAVYRDIGDSKDRITATVDADGNRTAITRDLT